MNMNNSSLPSRTTTRTRTPTGTAAASSTKLSDILLGGRTGTKGASTATSAPGAPFKPAPLSRSNSLSSMLLQESQQEAVPPAPPSFLGGVTKRSARAPASMLNVATPVPGRGGSLLSQVLQGSHNLQQAGGARSSGDGTAPLDEGRFVPLNAPQTSPIHPLVCSRQCRLVCVGAASP